MTFGSARHSRLVGQDVSLVVQRAVVLAVVLALPAPALGETFRVSPGGADNNAGTTEAPFRTLQRAADEVAPGDTVVVDDGNYTGFILTTSGTAGQRITFTAQGPNVVIDTANADGSGVLLENVGHVTIEGFHIVGMPGRGLEHGGATPETPVFGLLIRQNTVVNSGREGVYISEVAGSLVEGNVISGSGASGDTRSHGIYLANAGSDDTTIRGNVIFGQGAAESNGIHMNGDLSVGGDGIITGAVVENNIIHDNEQNAINMDGVQASLIRNNVLYGNGSNGIRGYAIDGAEGPADIVIVNNTIHQSAGWCVRLTEDLGGLVVFNNILVRESGGGGSIALDNTQGFASAHNAVVDRFTPDRDDTILSLTAWQGLGYDASSFVTTAGALFIDVGSEDYHLRADAPALDVGVVSFGGQQAPALDAESLVRPVGTAIDLGAYEHCPGLCDTGDAGVVLPGQDAGAPPEGEDGGSAAGPDGGTQTGPDGGTAPAADAGTGDAHPAGAEPPSCGCRAGTSQDGVATAGLAILAWAVVRRSRRSGREA